ncbi:hypothetical protein ACE193_17355 [Bernardetia sp. OM2101]|uniref:hypothetical protein n=1 Tax=Bernardetia sp. OM2101 TaxID=3344876 RepID=UPI0035CEB013
MNINNNIQNNINTNSENNSVKKSSSLKPIFPSVKRPAVDQPLAQTTHKNFIDTPTHFETDYISMKWLPEKRRIDVIWKQFVSEDKVREVLLREVAMIRHTKVTCLFLDAQKFKGTNPNIPRWANEVWSQMVHDAGLKHFATVVSDKDIFAVFSLKYGMGEKLMSLVNCAVFKTIEEGEVWLRQYTHPESPVYSDDELEEVMEEYENPTTDYDKNNIVAETEKIEKTPKPSFNTEIDKEEITKEEKEIVETEMTTPISKFDTETELQHFNLEQEITEQETQNDFEEEEEEIDEEDDNRLSQIQVFSDFEDLENHIQNIESKYKTKDECSDDSESQS